jgi:branched-chain amino acid transport system ATP-binding protein
MTDTPVASPVPALSVENIEVVYHHTVQVLRGLSLAVPEGRIVALLGSNGAGKTTTLKAISGLLPLEVGQVRAGAIRWRGERINDVAPHRLARMGIAHVREGRHVFEDLTVDENLVAASFALDGRPGAGKADTALIYEYFPA